MIVEMKGKTADVKKQCLRQGRAKVSTKDNTPLLLIPPRQSTLLNDQSKTTVDVKLTQAWRHPGHIRAIFPLGNCHTAPPQSQLSRQSQSDETLAQHSNLEKESLRSHIVTALPSHSNPVKESNPPAIWTSSKIGFGWRRAYRNSCARDIAQVRGRCPTESLSLNGLVRR